MNNKKALYPTSFVDDSLDCIEQVVSYCRAHSLDLYILYTYRLISPNGSDGSKSNLKREIEDKADFIYTKIEEELLKDSNIKYEFLSEVGFLSDRILNNLNVHNIDLIIVCESLCNRLEPFISQELLFDKPFVVLENTKQNIIT